jgi:hypothetical protein
MDLQWNRRRRIRP